MSVAAALQHHFAAWRDLQVAVGMVARLQAVFEIQIKHPEHQQAGGQRHATPKAAVGIVGNWVGRVRVHGGETVQKSTGFSAPGANPIPHPPCGPRNPSLGTGLLPEDIDYINAHGTATQWSDLLETQAIKKVFGDYACKVPVSSTKSMHGHTMGASGAMEFVVSLLAIKNQAVPPTINLDQPDPECDLDYVANIGRKGVQVNTVMSNSFAFGGTNAVLVARKMKG